MLWLTLLLQPLFSFGMTIAIDPGHGGGDHGAVFNGVKESHVVMGVARQLAASLNKDEGFKAFLTRGDDRHVELHHRVRVTQKQQADLFVSIHANSSPDPQSQGMEIYFRNELEPDEDSLRLANQENQSEEPLTKKKIKSKGDLQSILQDMRRSLSTLKSYELSWHVVDQWQVPFSKVRHLPIKQGPFHVIQQNVPSILVEIGFITNPKEAKRLASTAYQEHIAQAIHKGLKDFKETLEKGQTKAIK